MLGRHGRHGRGHRAAAGWRVLSLRPNPPNTPSMHGKNLLTPTDGWAVGGYGAILHWDGTD
jgi:hypothetical protein